MGGNEKRTREKYQKILEASYELMNTDSGLSGFTISQVCQKTGISKTTILKYFSSKDLLIQSVLSRILDQNEKLSDEVYGNESLPFDEKVKALIHQMFIYFSKTNPQLHYDLKEYVKKNPTSKFAIRFEKFFENHEKNLAALCEIGRQQGKIDPRYTNEFLVLYFRTIVHGISHPDVYQHIDYTYADEWSKMTLSRLARIDD
ncbi:TetR/AcrR family transcriptional regulator [Enterococcus hirae]|nr:TetR/AcrR family transcriptional regulator [Enterococcaceae bacterium]MCI1919991.1 TetR/AcrR family transcriptional regulator [Enterococcaceae bacterium]MDM8213039.1 TetR/AcrR family transcriptional regulator [Enterococcus hirae]